MRGFFALATASSSSCSASSSRRMRSGASSSCTSWPAPIPAVPGGSVSDAQPEAGDLTGEDIAPGCKTVRVGVEALDEVVAAVEAVRPVDQDPVASSVGREGSGRVGEADDQPASCEVEGKLDREGELVVAGGRIASRVLGKLGVGRDGGEPGRRLNIAAVHCGRGHVDLELDVRVVLDAEIEGDLVAGLEIECGDVLVDEAT